MFEKINLQVLIRRGAPLLSLYHWAKLIFFYRRPAKYRIFAGLKALSSMIAEALRLNKLAIFRGFMKYSRLSVIPFEPFLELFYLFKRLKG